MIYIETGSADVYYNFALEYYFTLEKRLPEPLLCTSELLALRSMRSAVR